MKQLTINFRATNKGIAKTIMVALLQGYKGAIKIQNKKAKKKGLDAYGEVNKILPGDGHHGGADVLITGPDDFIKDEEKKLQENLLKLMVQFKTEPKLSGGYYHKFKSMSQEWLRRNLMKAYALTGVSVDWQVKEVD